MAPKSDRTMENSIRFPPNLTKFHLNRILKVPFMCKNPKIYIKRLNSILL